MAEMISQQQCKGSAKGNSSGPRRLRNTSRYVSLIRIVFWWPLSLENKNPLQNQIHDPYKKILVGPSLIYLLTEKIYCA